MPVLSRLRRWCRERPDAAAILLLVGAILAANLPYLLDLFDPNPLGPRSGLATVTGGLFSGGNTVDPNVGYVSQALGHRAALDLLHGHLPWWNPYEGVGAPLAGELQSAVFFPTTWLTALSNGQLFGQILLEALAGAGTYLLLRRLHLGRAASLAAGIAYALNGTFAFYGHAPINPIPFLPLLLLGIELATDAARRRRGGGWWLIAVSVALSLYAGFPETAYLDGLLALGWFAWRCGTGGRRQLRRLAGKGAAGLSVGILLAAPILIVFLGTLQHSSTGTQPMLAGSMHLPGLALPQLLLPYVYGPFSAFSDPGGVLLGIWGRLGGYLTSTLVLLAGVGVLARPRPALRGLRLVLAAWLVLGLGRIYGVPVLGGVLGLLPGMSSIFFFRYAFPATELAVVVLAACGIDALVRGVLPRRVLLAPGFLLASVLGALALEAHRLVPKLSGGSGHTDWAWGAVAWGCGTAVTVLLVALRRRPAGRARWLASVVIVDALVLFSVHEFSAPRAVHLDLAPVRFLSRHLGLGRFFTLGPLQPQYGAYFKLASVNDDDDPLPRAWATYVTKRLDPVPDPLMFVGNGGGARSPSAPSSAQELLARLDGYRAAGVRYVLTPAEQQLPQRRGALTEVFHSATTRIYALAGATPYFTSTGGGCSIRSADRQAVWLGCPAPTRLVRHELFFPGWSAWIDGHRTGIGTTEGLYQGVEVPAGTHKVTFRYQPPGIWWGLLGLLLGAGWLGLSLSRSASAASGSSRFGLRPRG